jgi:hypothetical protein
LDIYLQSLEYKKQSEYILEHQSQLLPDWQEAPRTIIFLFFQCQLPLDGTDLIAEQLEKDRLLLEFYHLGSQFYTLAQNQGIVAEVICPKDGTPLYSSKGSDSFNITAIVTRYLPSFQQISSGCGLIHPEWGRCVYPSLILSQGIIKR